MTSRAPLEALLSAYTPDAGEERAHRSSMLALLEAPGDPFARGHFAPGHFTASGFVLSPDGSTLLLVHHRKLDRWLQPGGHVEPDDIDLVAAARRELNEEVGLLNLPLEIAGVFDLDVHAIPPLGDEPAHAHFDVRFLFRSADLALHAASDAKAARWVKMTRIGEVTSDRSVMRAARKLMRPTGRDSTTRGR
jgi:8-oxo-dGTP pyrophosphatase MutT (NUDIX family)